MGLPDAIRKKLLECTLLLHTNKRAALLFPEAAGDCSSKHVWHLRDSDDARVDAAIQKTTEFYESLGIPTQLSAYGLGQDTIDAIVKRLENNGVSYGEHADITPGVVRRILERSL